jgi:hypothetical protein
VNGNVLGRADDEESIPPDENVVDIVDLEYRWRIAFVPELNLLEKPNQARERGFAHRCASSLPSERKAPEHPGLHRPGNPC